ncbi:hypothetical protein ONS95_010468 [Cadophora gregata]|uniref:uncharacterized protein n=1 Tax=Cadophora gregata TaxID=51156 RepID=UPI0026DBA9D3|nr:uncharacterized protein ONS95_010468 [Cadophora gregata]KAK0122213.1 hypothetical protein ONS95_010468 [Cadophora gregata]
MIREANGGLCCANGLVEYGEPQKTRIPRPDAGSSRRLVRREQGKQERIPQPRVGVSRLPEHMQQMRAAQKPISQPQAGLVRGVVQREQKRGMSKPLPQPPAGQCRKPAATGQMKNRRVDQVQAPPLPLAPRMQSQGDHLRKPIPMAQKEARRPGLRRVNRQESLRADTRKAAQIYGQDRQRRDSFLEPELNKQCIMTPGGGDPRTFGMGHPIHEPLYKEPPIDWNRWSEAIQGSHGRLPPEHKAPLPIRPLNIGQAQNGQSIARKPVPITKPDRLPRERSMEHGSPCVSPMSSNASLRVEDMMSDVGGQVNAAMGDWNRQYVSRYVSPMSSPIAPPPPVVCWPQQRSIG